MFLIISAKIEETKYLGKLVSKADLNSNIFGPVNECEAQS